MEDSEDFLDNVRKQFLADTEIVSSSRRLKKELKETFETMNEFHDEVIELLYYTKFEDEDKQIERMEKIDKLEEMQRTNKERKEIVLGANDKLIESTERRRQRILEVLEKLEDVMD